jgi:hypothetical protein
MAKESVEELLKQAIAASDRTTFAVRAFVLFLFLQLAFTSIAAVFVWFGYTSYNGFVFVIFGLVIFFLGVIVSSVVGWGELGDSGVGLGLPVSSSPEITYETHGTHVESAATPASRYPSGRINPKVARRNNEDASEGRVCSGCVKYTTNVYCEHCGAKE